MTVPIILCPWCKWFHGGRKCDAFPDGIPPEILFGDIRHRVPYPGDHGFQYIRIDPGIEIKSVYEDGVLRSD